MARNRKFYAHGMVYYVTFRILEGLPLPPNKVVIELIKSSLARAQELYPVKIGDCLFMGNHPHLFISPINPSDMSNFIRHFKTESARRINIMLGKIKGAVWESGCDSPIVLDLEKYMEKAIYILTNPQKANLVETIDSYPHLSSWQVKTSESTKIPCMRLYRNDTPTLPKGKISISLAKDHVATLKEESKHRDKQFLEIDLKFFFDALKHTTDRELTFYEFREEVIQGVREEEEKLSSQRKKENKGVLGKDALKTQSIHKQHTPKKFGKRMLCLASKVTTRVRFITIFRELIKECKRIFLRWKSGDRSINFPPGFYPPGGVIQCASALFFNIWED